MVINVDSPDQAFDAQLALEGAPQDAPKEACAPPNDGILAGGSPRAKGVMVEAPLEVVAAPLFSTRLTSADPRRPRMPNRLLLSSYVPPHEWVYPLVDTIAPGPEGAREIIDHWSPFNKREYLCTTSTLLFSGCWWGLC